MAFAEANFSMAELLLTEDAAADEDLLDWYDLSARVGAGSGGAALFRPRLLLYQLLHSAVQEDNSRFPLRFEGSNRLNDLRLEAIFSWWLIRE